MRLVKFSVTNFRSITAAHEITINDSTVLVGKNNEGKSNILKALSIAMRMIQDYHYQTRLILPSLKSNSENRYRWERDFPVNSQDNSEGESIFKLAFEFNDEEILEFKEIIGSTLNGILRLETNFGYGNQAAIKLFSITKKGEEQEISQRLISDEGIETLISLNSKKKQIEKIVSFIAKKISFNYIPAVRTDRAALSIIEMMLSQEMKRLEKETEYQEALDIIKKKQEPVLKDLGERIKKSLLEFLPNITDVKIEISEQERRTAFNKDFEVVIDDGIPTNIKFKGDGVKSLAALALLKDSSIKTGNSIVAIEEPESHLHPAAIHQLTKIIESLKENSQVIITTHNPLFVNRQSLESNIIISKGEASPAKSIKEIRDILGVKTSDNLTNASYVLVVEGECDKIALNSLLPYLSEQLKECMHQNLLVIQSLGGAGNLSYMLSLINNMLCSYHVMLDNDDAGRKSNDKATNDGFITIKNCTMLNCRGMKNSEFEDCFDSSVYKQKICDVFGVNLDDTESKGNSKWSDRMKSVFMHQGKPWNEEIERNVKIVVSNCIAENPDVSLNAHKRNSIDALVSDLESLIRN